MPDCEITDVGDFIFMKALMNTWLNKNRITELQHKVVNEILDADYPQFASHIYGQGIKEDD